MSLSFNSISFNLVNPKHLTVYGLLLGTMSTEALCEEMSKMLVDITFKFLHVSTVREAKNKEGIPKSSSPRKRKLLK